MAFKLIVLVCAIACAQAGIITPAAYTAHPAPVAYAAAPATYTAHPAPVAYAAAPATYTAHPAPVAYAHAPATYAAHPAQLTYAAAPVVHAAPVAYAAPVAKVAAVAPLAKVAVEEYDHHPQYSFAYDVQDGLTGDSKTQHETRDGDVVRGSYSVVDPDGTKRTVEYTADDHNGFNAVVHKEPLGHVAKVAVAPVAYAAPVAKVAAPVAYAAAPVVHHAPVVHAAPVAYSAPHYHH